MDPLISETEAVKISEDDDENDGQANPEGALNESEATTQFKLNDAK